MMTKPLDERLDDLAAKVSLASFVASSEDTLGEQPQVGFYLLLWDSARELREIAEAVRKSEAPK
jgi:hypothetical protein